MVEFPEAVALATATPTAGRRCGLSWPRASMSAASSSTPAAAAVRELGATGRGALLFYWHPLGRQVWIEGRIERVSDRESEEYFHGPAAARLLPGPRLRAR